MAPFPSAGGGGGAPSGVGDASAEARTASCVACFMSPTVSTPGSVSASPGTKRSMAPPSALGAMRVASAFQNSAQAPSSTNELALVSKPRASSMRPAAPGVTKPMLRATRPLSTRSTHPMSPPDVASACSYGSVTTSKRTASSSSARLGILEETKSRRGRAGSASESGAGWIAIVPPWVARAVASPVIDGGSRPLCRGAPGGTLAGTGLRGGAAGAARGTTRRGGGNAPRSTPRSMLRESSVSMVRIAPDVALTVGC